jgi:hypothetical protein
MLTVMLSQSTSGPWEVRDISGKMIAKGAIPARSFSFSVPLGDIAGGIYFLWLTDEANAAHVRKFVVIH